MKGRKSGGDAPERGARSKAIRDYLGLNPSHSPNQVVAALAEQGIVVKAGLVSAIKYGGKGKKAGAKGAAKRSGRKATGAGQPTIDDLIDAKKLADRLGGVDAAISLLNKLSQLQ